ncbi:MAG: Ryanodine receptor Ryr [Nitrospirae bacterium]|nr:Ryanodine receptor Ryr [Nitrospirota bacterium]
MDYTPKPTDTSAIRLPDYLIELTEKLAENNHDLWAQKRIAEGWTYGPNRDDAKKTHPDLVPYAELPESEKEYDRVTAMETLKTIMALGFSIVR